MRNEWEYDEEDFLACAGTACKAAAVGGDVASKTPGTAEVPLFSHCTKSISLFTLQVMSYQKKTLPMEESLFWKTKPMAYRDNFVCPTFSDWFFMPWFFIEKKSV